MRAARRVVLVVNAEDAVRAAQRVALEQRGYTVMASHNVAGGLRLAELVRPDALVIEIGPDPDEALGAVARLRADSRTQGVCIFATAARRDADLETRARKAGCVIVSDGLDNDAIVAAVEAHLGGPDLGTA